jgi:ABC-type transport system substrate-binding protein
VLQTSTTIGDFVPQATLLQQQAKAAGVTVVVQTIDPATYWTSANGYLSRPFGQVEYWSIPTLSYFYLQNSWTGASYPETHWGSSAEDALLFDAIGELDRAKAQEKWHAVQLGQFERGGYLIPNTKDYLDSVANTVNGLTPSRYGYLGGYRLADAWLA